MHLQIVTGHLDDSASVGLAHSKSGNWVAVARFLTPSSGVMEATLLCLVCTSRELSQAQSHCSSYVEEQAEMAKAS